MLNIMYGMNHTCENFALTKLFASVFQMRKSLLFSLFVTHMLAVDILVPRGLPIKFQNVVCFGLLCFVIFTRFVRLVRVVKRQVIQDIETKCPLLRYLFAKYSTYGVLILWVHFPPLLAMYIFFLLQITFPNGSKLRLLGLIMLRLWQILSNLIFLSGLVRQDQLLVIVGSIFVIAQWSH